MSNDDKSVWEPCQEKFWLDIIWQELDQYTKDEIIFWKDNIDLVKSRFCFLDKKKKKEKEHKRKEGKGKGERPHFSNTSKITKYSQPQQS